MSLILRKWKEDKIKKQLDILEKTGALNKIADILKNDSEFINKLYDVMKDIALNKHLKPVTNANLFNNLTNVGNADFIYISKFIGDSAINAPIKLKWVEGNKSMILCTINSLNLDTNDILSIYRDSFSKNSDYSLYYIYKTNENGSELIRTFRHMTYPDLMIEPQGIISLDVSTLFEQELFK